jgi:PAB-dependent poly(A)-specific ribonuclease subunit 3
MSQFSNQSSIPYWSPSSQRLTTDDNSGGKLSSKNSVKANISGLASSAAEFVPQQRLTHNATEFVPRSFTSSETSRLKSESLLGSTGGLSSMNGLNSSAASWIPSSLKVEGGQIDVSSKEVGSSADEVMVEVNYNGSTFFVPASTAAAYSQYAAQPDGDGKDIMMPEPAVDWSYGTTTAPAPPKRTLQTIGIPEPIRQHFQGLDIEANRVLPPDDDRHNEVPARFHSILALDSMSVPRGAGGSFGYPSAVFKAVDRSDSQIYCLRRFDNVRSCQSTVIKNALTRWQDIRHPAIVSLYSITQERGGTLFFAHAYHPTATTLKQRFIDQAGGPLVSEPLLWRILTQLMAGLRLVHNRGFAIRHISPTHILLTSGTMARFNSVGVTDVLEFESRKPMTELQYDDIVKLGFVVLSLATKAVVTQKTADMALKHLHQTYSAELYRVVAAMVSGKLNLTQISAMMLDKLQDELDATLASTDALHSHLRSEYENGRVLRLLMKFGVINERPEMSLAPEVIPLLFSLQSLNVYIHNYNFHIVYLVERNRGSLCSQAFSRLFVSPDDGRRHSNN